MLISDCLCWVGVLFLGFCFLISEEYAVCGLPVFIDLFSGYVHVECQLMLEAEMQ